MKYFMIIRSKREEKGQSLVEMALVVLIFLFLLFGIIEFGRALWTYNTIVHFTRAAARWAVANAKVTRNVSTYTIDSTDLSRTKNIVRYGDPDVSSGSTVIPGIADPSVTINVSVVALDLDSFGVPINSKVSVSVSGYQFHFIVPIAPTITIPAYETSLYTEALGRTS